MYERNEGLYFDKERLFTWEGVQAFPGVHSPAEGQDPNDPLGSKPKPRPKSEPRRSSRTRSEGAAVTMQIQIADCRVRSDRGRERRESDPISTSTPLTRAAPAREMT